MVRSFAERTHARLFLCPAHDTVAGLPANDAQQSAIASLDPKQRSDLPDVLEIVVGMQCMVTENVHTLHGAANGSRGTITGICLDPREPEILSTTVTKPHLQ
jgi:hypothetical protein